MSPRPGGEAAKFGERFEARWTVRSLLDVLFGHAEAVIVEAVDPDADSVEFFVTVGGRQQGHQAKRQRRGVSWPLTALDKEGILAAAATHVRRGREFHFSSTLPARDLDELTDAARRADDFAAFGARIASPNRLRDGFDILASRWGSPQDAFAILRDVYVWKPDERHLHATNVAFAETLVEGPPEAAVAVLAQIVLDNLGVTLTSDRLWTEIENRGLRRNPLRDDTTLSRLVSEQAERWLAGVQRELLHPPIDRDETRHAVEILRRDSRPVMAVGGAGFGKSAVLAAVVETLRGDGWPVLPLRLDRHGGVHTARQLGEQLDLPSSPVISLGTVAAGEPALLVIDQLDAVSLASGRSTHVFDAIDEMLRQARRLPNLRILLSCRQFDVDNDHRLRALIDASSPEAATVITVPPLTAEKVDAAIGEMGLDPSTLHAAQRELLRTPLNLVLLRGVAREADAISFATTNDLLERFWRVKRQAITQRRLPQPTRFDDVVAKLVDTMSESQRLSVPEAVLYESGLETDADVLISEHVIVKDRGRYAFFHESLFDFAFARSWSATNRSVLEFLLAGEQELFRRAQVRQVLTQMREVNTRRFIDEACAVLINDRVRFHVKDSLIALLRALPDPSSDELRLIFDLLEQDRPWRDRLELLLRTEPWFDRLYEDGIFVDWLASDPDLQVRAITIIGTAGSNRPEAEAELLSPYRQHPEFAGWLLWVIRFGSPEKSRDLFELVLDAVRAGTFEGREHELWLSTHGVPDAQPVWAVELLAAWLMERPASLAVDNSRIVDMSASDHGLLELARKAAEAAPLEFGSALLPYMQRVMAHASYGQHRPISDYHFSGRIWSQHLSDLDETLMFAMVTALKKVAEADAARLPELLAPLADDPHEAAQILLYEALTAGGAAHADWAADLLLRGPQALEAGYSDNHYWTTRELLLAAASHMDDGRYARVEAMLMDYAPEWERRHPPARGHASFTLMSALPSDRLSEHARRKLEELRRKFGRHEPEPPRGIVGGFVGSPIGTDSARSMSDQQWLRAMRRHASDEGDRRGLELRGGAHELAQVLAALTKEQPDRFARLALRIDGSYNSSYLDQILVGLGDAEVDFDAVLVYDAIRHAVSVGDHDRWLGYALKRLYRAPIPADVIEILIERALGHRLDEPEREDGRDTSDPADFGDPHMSGINSERGANVSTLATLVAYDTDGDRARLVEPHVGEMARDPSVAVCTCVAKLLHALIRWHADSAVAAFRDLVADVRVELLVTPQFEGLAAAIVLTDVSVVMPTIEFMLSHHDENVREHGARLATFAATDADQDEMLHGLVNADDTALRRGAAAVLADRARWIDTPSVREALIRLLCDEDGSVQEAAARFVVHLRGEDLAPFNSLLEAFIDSPALMGEGRQLIFTLEESTGDIHELTLRLVNRFLDIHAGAAGDITTRAAGDARALGKLVLRAYAQAGEPDLRAELLDVIDRLLELSAYGFQDAVDEAARQ